MSFSIDFSKLDIPAIGKLFREKEMLPGRRPLLDGLEEKLAAIQKAGVHTADQLINRIGNKQKRMQLSIATSIPEPYLNLLRREIQSYESKPIPLNKLPIEEEGIILSLISSGIKNTKQLLEIQQEGSTTEIANRLDIPESNLRELFGLSDLLRIPGIGPVFARVMFNTGLHSAGQFLNEDPEVILEKYSTYIQEHDICKVQLGIKDIQYCFDLGKFLPQS